VTSKGVFFTILAATFYLSSVAMNVISPKKLKDSYFYSKSSNFSEYLAGDSISASSLYSFMVKPLIFAEL